MIDIPARRPTPPNYEEKFVDFIRMCEESKASGVQAVIVPTPYHLGDTYEELM